MWNVIQLTPPCVEEDPQKQPDVVTPCIRGGYDSTPHAKKGPHHQHAIASHHALEVLRENS